MVGLTASIIQLATATGFAGLVWFLIVKHIPSIEDRHKAERAEWLQYMEKRDTTYNELATNHIETITEIKSQLASIREDLGRIGK